MENFVWLVHKVVDKTLTHRLVDGLPQWATHMDFLLNIL